MPQVQTHASLPIAAVHASPPWWNAVATVARTTVAAFALLGAERVFAAPVPATAPAVVLEESPLEQMLEQDRVQEESVKQQQIQDQLQQQHELEQQQAARQQQDQWLHDHVIEEQNNQRIIEQNRQRQEDLQKYLNHQRTTPGYVPPFVTRPQSMDQLLQQMMNSRNRGHIPSPGAAPPAPPAAPIERRPPVRRPQAKARSRLKTPTRHAPIRRPSSPPTTVSRPGNRP